MPRSDHEFERYISYKSYFIALIAGILLGVFTNYVTMFFPFDIRGFFISLIALFAIGWFFVSRFFVPNTAVFQEFPENVKPSTLLTFKDDFDILAKRFIFRANTAGTIFDTMFTLPKSGLKESSTLWRPNYFLSLNKEKHKQEIAKTVRALDLTELEEKELEQRINKMYEPFFVQAGQAFHYRSTRNWLLRGKGIFFLTEFGKPGIGCIITPSSFSTLSRHFEQYHINLRENLSNVLLDLLKDEKFQHAISRIFRE